MHPWEAVSGLAQFRSWLRDNAQGLVETLAAATNLETAIVARVLEALHCDAMGGRAAGDPCPAGVVHS